MPDKKNFEKEILDDELPVTVEADTSSGIIRETVDETSGGEVVDAERPDPLVSDIPGVTFEEVENVVSEDAVERPYEEAVSVEPEDFKNYDDPNPRAGIEQPEEKEVVIVEGEPAPRTSRSGRTFDAPVGREVKKG